MKTILVQMSDKSWTTQAIHLACALARHNEAEVVLLRLIQVRHPGLLGTNLGDREMTSRELQDLSAYDATARDYAIGLSVRQMQCATALDALVDAADQIDADVVFAHIDKSYLPFWRRFQIWALERRLAASHRQLFTLDRPNAALGPLSPIAIQPAPGVTGK
jgi:hypothetical protein